MLRALAGHLSRNAATVSMRTCSAHLVSAHLASACTGPTSPQTCGHGATRLQELYRTFLSPSSDGLSMRAIIRIVCNKHMALDCSKCVCCMLVAPGKLGVRLRLHLQGRVYSIRGVLVPVLNDEALRRIGLTTTGTGLDNNDQRVLSQRGANYGMTLNTLMERFKQVTGPSTRYPCLLKPDTPLHGKRCGSALYLIDWGQDLIARTVPCCNFAHGLPCHCRRGVCVAACPRLNQLFHAGPCVQVHFISVWVGVIRWLKTRKGPRTECEP